jgi:hypothetical protein
MLNETPRNNYMANLVPFVEGPEQRRETAVDNLEDDDQERISPIGLYSQQGRQPNTGTKLNLDLV